MVLHTQKTRVTQMPIYFSSDAPGYFERESKGPNIPIVLVPKDYGLGFRFFVNIPSGVFVLHQKWHKHTGMLDAGLIPIWGAWNRVSHVVTKSTVTYNVPIRKVPTYDNVFVDIDISLNFQIGPDDEAAYRFVYNLGADRLDDMLSSQTDEAVRGLVYSVPYKKVHDLRESFARGTMKSLNDILKEYGVIIRGVKVTQVELPTQLSETLESTTAFKSKMQEQEKKHENNMRVLQNNETQSLTALKQSNERQKQLLIAQKERCLIERERMRSQAQSDSSVALTDMKSKCSVRITQAKADKEIAEAQGKRDAEELLGRTKMQCESKTLSAEQEARNMTIKSKAMIKQAEARASAIIADADTEAQHAEHFADLRYFEVEKERMQVLENIALNGKFVVSGKTGENILKGICPGSEDDLLIKSRRLSEP